MAVNTEKRNNSNVNNINNKRMDNQKGPNITLVLVVILLVIIGSFLLTSSVFLVTNIEVSGNEKLTKEEVIQISKILPHKNIFLEGYLKGEYLLKNTPRIEHAKIEMALPSTVRIYVTERKEQYQLVHASGYYILDKDGYILKKTDTKNNLPILKGLKKEYYDTDEERIEEGDLYTLDKVNKLYRNLVSLEMLDMIDEIEVTPKEYIMKSDREKKTIKLELTTNDIRGQLLKIKEVINETSGKEGQILIDKNDKREYIIFKEKV